MARSTMFVCTLPVGYRSASTHLISVVAIGNTLTIVFGIREFFPSKVHLCFVKSMSNVIRVVSLHNSTK